MRVHHARPEANHLATDTAARRAIVCRRNRATEISHRFGAGVHPQDATRVCVSKGSIEGGGLERNDDTVRSTALDRA